MQKLSWGGLSTSEALSLIAYIRYGNHKEAAAAREISTHTFKHELESARNRMGAKTTSHLAWLMYPRIGYLFDLPPTRRDGGTADTADLKSAAEDA